MKFGHKPSFASSKKIIVATVKILAKKNCIGYIGQILKNRDFRKSEKSTPFKIENCINMYFC